MPARGPHTKGVSTNATNVDAPPSGSQPALPGRAEVGDSTTKSRLEGDTSQVPWKSSGGLGTTTGSQKETQSAASAETLVNDGAPSGGSQSAPSEQVGGKDSTAESIAGLDTLKASQHTLDIANPSQRRDTTTGSQTKTQSAASAKTPVNLGVPPRGSQSVPPEQVGVEDSAAKSHSELDTLKASQPPQPSGGLDPTTASQKETHRTEPTRTLEKVGAPSGDLQPAPPEQVGGKDSTTKSHSKVNMSKAPQPPQPSSGPGTTTEPQKDLEPTKIPGNVCTPSGDSQPTAPEQVGVEISTAESRSEVDTTKASQRALDGANPQSSNGIDKTTNSQTELYTARDERTDMNTADVGTPSPPKDLDSSKNQSNIHAQGSHLTSEEVKDGTIPDQPSSHARHSDHTSGVVDQNEKSSNASKSCEDVSTSSINTEVNQLPQKEDPRDTQGANKQKASDIVQVGDDQATTPSMEEDINQQMTKYEGDIRGLKATILSIQTFASQQAGERREEIKRLEAKISSLEKIVDLQQEKDNEKDVESFKARISDMEAWIFRTEHGISMEHKKEIARLEGKQEKDIQRLEEIVGHLRTKVSSMEHAEHKQEIEYLKREHEKEIQRLEAVIASMSEQASKHAEHKQEIEYLKREHEKEIQRLEAVIASMSEQASKLEKEIGRLQPKVSTEEDAKQPGKRQAQDPPKRLDEKPIASGQALQATKYSSAAASPKIKCSAQQPGVKLQIPSPSIKTNILSPLAVVPKADTLSVTDVGNLVKALNADIGQTVNLLTESLSNLEEPPTSDNETEIDFDELRNYLGPGLCDKLKAKSEFDPLITQLALQMGLVNACSSVVNHSPFLRSGSILQTLYSRMAEKEGQAAADEWRAKAFNYLDLPQCEDANKKYLTEVLLKLTTAAGGTLKSSKSLLSQYNQQVETIAKSAAKLHKTITEEVRSSELITFIVSWDTKFDASRMEDSENEGNKGSTPHGKVICTQEMGLLCKKRVEPQNGSSKDWGVTTKAKVVLASTLEG